MRFLREAMTPLALLVLAGVVFYDHVSTRPSPDPTVNGVALGKAFSPILVSTYADAWLAAAKTLESGKTVNEAQKTLQDTWKEGRVKAFVAEVGPGFALVLPEGTEPSNPSKRAQVAELWRSFAKGLKGGR